ncbi:unnamed protein product, partial [Rotaria sordida]
NTSFISAII